MKRIVKVLIAASAVAVSMSASAAATCKWCGGMDGYSFALDEQYPNPPKQDIMANSPYSAYVQDSRGVIARSGTWLCWRTGYWTPADAVNECEGIAGEAPAPAAVPESRKIAYSADAFFDFDKAVLKPEGKASLDKLVEDLQPVDLELMVATGHTDSIGSDAYNMRLGARRAQAVKAYLISKGIPEDKIFTESKGEREPVATNKTKEGRAQNRRVVIEVVGTSKDPNVTIDNYGEGSATTAPAEGSEGAKESSEGK